MCGILAGITTDPAVEICKGEETEKRVKGLLHQTSHRGPDEEDVVQLGKAWLGHNRLSIVSVENGKQPICSKSGNKYAVVNGEIYNHKELKKELGLTQDDLTTNSDSEIVIHGINAWGLDCCDKLLGMFSFVMSA